MIGRTNTAGQMNTEEGYFGISLAPVTWTEVVAGTDYTASNQYGTWTISAGATAHGSTAANAFDGDPTTYWYGATTDAIELDTPINIKPLSIYIKYENHSTSKGIIEAYNVLKEEWEILTSLPEDKSLQTLTLNLGLVQFYNKFRFKGSRAGSISYRVDLYEFTILTGYYQSAE